MHTEKATGSSLKYFSGKNTPEDHMQVKMTRYVYKAIKAEKNLIVAEDTIEKPILVNNISWKNFVFQIAVVTIFSKYVSLS